MSSIHQDYSSSNAYKILLHDTMEWGKVIRDSPLFNEAGRENAIQDLRTNFWKKVHKLKQNYQGKLLQGTGNRLEEADNGDVMPMECDPTLEHSNVPDVSASEYTMSGMVPELGDVSAPMHSSVPCAAGSIKFAIPSVPKTFGLQQPAMPQQPLAIDPQISGHSDYVRENMTVTHASSEDSIATALSTMAITPETQAGQQPPPTPPSGSDLVAERNKWRESGEAREHKRAKSTGVFPCLEGCTNKFFTRARDRERHYRDVHRRQTPYRCPYCDSRLSRKDVVKRHIKNGVCMKRKGCTA